MSSTSTSSSDFYTSKQKLDEDNRPEPEPSLTQEQIEARYQQVKHELDKDGVTTQLATAFEALLAQSEVDHISKCLCTSLGSLTSEKYVKIDGQPNRPMYQLAAFEIMKASLENHLKKIIPSVRVQDPEMNNLDKIFLRNLSYEVIEHPQALEEVARNIFVFTPGALFVHVRDLFDEFWPAIYVGVDLVQWIESKKPNEKYEAKTNELLKEDWPEEKKVYDRWIAPYVDVTTSRKLVIMNEKYPSPTVMAYVAKMKW
ncbi:MAG: hypothetical protein Q9198_001898 [Flavoplaca austrocitrina]